MTEGYLDIGESHLGVPMLGKEAGTVEGDGTDTPIGSTDEMDPGTDEIQATHDQSQDEH